MTNRYENYKPSGIEWLGDIPNHWNIKKGKDIFTVNGRIGYRGYTVEDIVKENEGAIALSPSNIKNMSIDLSKNTWINFLKYEESPEIKVFRDDILLVKTGSTTGKSSIFNIDVDKATINPQMALIKNHKKPKFLHYYMNSLNFKFQVEIYKNTNTMPTITQQHINNFIFIDFNEKEQELIADYLDKKIASIDNSIEKLKDQKETLIEQKQVIIHKAVTKGLDDGVKMKDSGFEWIGDIPKHWKINRMKEYIEVLSSGIKKFKEEKNYLTTKSINENGINSIDSKITMENRPSRANMQPKMYSIWIAYMKDTNKMLYIEDKEIVDNYIISTGMFGFIPKKNNFKKYFSYLIKGMNFINQKNILAKGTTQVSVNDSDFKNIYLILPNTYKEQKEITDYLDKKTSKIEEAVYEIEKQINLLEEYKNTLINDVVTGKIKVF